MARTTIMTMTATTSQRQLIRDSNSNVNNNDDNDQNVPYRPSKVWARTVPGGWGAAGLGQVAASRLGGGGASRARVVLIQEINLK